MTKITKDLLRKYDSRTCTEAELNIVQQWLYSNDSKEEIDYTLLSETELEMETELIWSRLNQSQKISEHSTNVISLYQKLMPYAAVACLVIGLFATAHFISNQKGNSELSSQTIVQPKSTNGNTHVVDHVQWKQVVLSGREDTVLAKGLEANTRYELNTCNKRVTIIRKKTNRRELFVFETRNLQTGESNTILCEDHIQAMYYLLHWPQNS